MRRALVVLLVLTLAVAPGSMGCDRAAIAHSSVADETRAVVQVRCDPSRPTRAACVDRWKATALRVGWRSSEWPWLRCVMFRESRGNPRAKGDGGRSLGLMQINWPSWEKWLKDRGLIRRRSDLYNPAVNLRAAKRILGVRGEKAWKNTRRGC